MILCRLYDHHFYDNNWGYPIRDNSTGYSLLFQNYVCIGHKLHIYICETFNVKYEGEKISDNFDCFTLTPPN